MNILGIVIQRSKTAQKAKEEVYTAGFHMGRQIYLHDNGFQHMLENRPDPDERVVLMRSEWKQPRVCRLSELNATTNCNGLFWRSATNAD